MALQQTRRSVCSAGPTRWDEVLLCMVFLEDQKPNFQGPVKGLRLYVPATSLMNYKHSISFESAFRDRKEYERDCRRAQKGDGEVKHLTGESARMIEY